MLTIDEARAAILAATRPLPAEDVALADADGRVLAEDVAAAHDVPPFDNSAMDGFAVCGEGPSFALIGESRAGAPFAGSVGPGEAVTISTGAAVPEGVTAVVPIEWATESDEETVSIAQAVVEGQHIRRAGEDLRAGARVLTAGTRVGAAELGVAAGAGRGTLSVAKRPRVAIVATGDELVPAGEPLQPGQIHDSNALTLAALSRRLGAEVVAIERAGDDRAATTAAIERALAQSDLLLVSGGVSVGPHDHVKPALESLGVTEVFWRVALRPGKPTWFGGKGDVLVLGLPGNPVSAIVTFHLFAKPALLGMQGAAPPKRSRVSLAAPYPQHGQREEAVRVTIDAKGNARTTGPQGSHVLSSMLGADGLALIPRGEGTVDSADVEPL